MVSLTIRSTKGLLVRTLLTAGRDAGPVSVGRNRKDHYVRRVPSGSYVANVEAVRDGAVSRASNQLRCEVTGAVGLHRQSDGTRSPTRGGVSARPSVDGDRAGVRRAGG